MTLVKVPRREAVIGYGAAVGAAFCYGVLAVIGRKIVSDFAPPMVATSFSMIFGTFILAAIFQKRIRSDYTARLPGQGWLFVALAGVASTWGVSFWFLALSKSPAILVAPLAAVHPLVSVILALVFLRGVERVTWRTVVGTMLVVGGVVLITLGVQ